VSSLAADVVTRCRIDRPQVCFEQIVLHASGSVVEQVSSAVASLLLRDLPTILWWPDDIREQSELLRRLMDLCDGVIVDSASFAEPTVSLPTLLSLLQQQSSIVADLQWARLNGWRDITAQFFDTPASRAYLDDLTSVEVDVRVGDRPGLPAAGLLYVAWLAGRLGWRLDTVPLAADAGGQFALTAGDRQVAITLRAVARDETTGDQISAVRLQAGTADKITQFAIHCASEDQVTTRTAEAGMPPVERSMRLAAPTDSMMLAQMLGYLRRDAVYERSMRLLGGWLGVSPGGQ
jgi:glucose-6-phosphate dehydrogenase assembly protein OpcA